MIHLPYSHTINLDKVDEHTARIRFIIYYNNKRIAFSLGYKVETSKWDTATQRAMPRTTHGKRKTPAYLINNAIERYQDETARVFARFESLDVTPTHDQVKASVTQAVRRTEESSDISTLEQLIDAYISEKSTLNQWSIGTVQRHRTIRNKLLTYTPNASTSDLDEKWLSGYYRRLVYTDKLTNNTAIDQLKRAKLILKWGHEKGYGVPNDFQSFNPNVTKTKREIIFLEWDELMHLYNFNFPLEYQRNVRDCFCFQCFTSLRYSDIKQLRKSNITDTHIIVTTQKTTDLLHIDLNYFSKEILSRHANSGGEYALPVYANQVYNRYLKEICAVAGIDAPITITDIKAGERVTATLPKYALITSHAGRRTFICHALRLGIPPSIVMQWTGHTDYNAMRPYIGIMDSAKKDAMKLFSQSKLSSEQENPESK